MTTSSPSLRSTLAGRTKLETVYASELADQIKAGRPDQIAIETLLGLKDGQSAQTVAKAASTAVVLDSFRTRPRYFDGRFLTGADLMRDQDYIRQRQSDLARASGFGVVQGLQVSIMQNTGFADSLSIQPGHGITPMGDVVVVGKALDVKLADLPAVRNLNSRFGLRLEASQPIGKRSGLFILALRAVEFTANPITAYPTSVTGPRGMADGDIVEATAVTLTPYEPPNGAVSLDDMRGAAAREIFAREGSGGVLQDALPLAMLALENGSLRWLDMHMVRRETGADTPLQVTLGGPPRAVAEAHVLQYEQQLAQVIADNNGAAFSAISHFGVLPAAGRMPLASVTLDTFGFLESFFPPAVDVDFSFIAADELAALVEESLTLPPIDLMGDGADLDATSVVVLMPVERQMLPAIRALLPTNTAPLSGTPMRLPRLQAPAGLMRAMLMRRSLLLDAPVALAPADPMSGWRQAWQMASANLTARRDGQQNLLWYVRRRTVPSRAKLEGVAKVVTGQPQAGPSSDPASPIVVAPALSTTAQLLARWYTLRVDELDLKERVGTLRDKAPIGKEAVDALLSDPILLRARPVFLAVVMDLSERASELDERSVAELRRALRKRDAGAGFVLLQQTSKERLEVSPKASAQLASNKLVEDVDAWLLKQPRMTDSDADNILDLLNNGTAEDISNRIAR
jgi:hypothetical protein